MKLENWIKRAKALKRLADKTVASKKVTRQGTHYVNNELYVQLRSSGLAFLRNCFGTDHPFYAQFDAEMGKGASPRNAEDGRAVLTSVLDELKGGWLQSIRGTITADVFGDFLDMASHLLDDKFIDAAAVIAGGSLEAHLRALCMKAGISTLDAKGKYKKAAVMNTELHKAGLYPLSDEKQITAWLGLRNDAAHGHRNVVNQGSVKLMIDGIRHFISTHNA